MAEVVQTIITATPEEWAGGGRCRSPTRCLATSAGEVPPSARETFVRGFNRVGLGTNRLKIFIPITVLALAILVPVNYTNNTLESVASLTYNNIDKLSISNIPLGSQRFWIHILMAYAFSFWTCYVLYKEYERITSMRLQFLSSARIPPCSGLVLKPLRYHL